MFTHNCWCDEALAGAEGEKASLEAGGLGPAACLDPLTHGLHRVIGTVLAAVSPELGMDFCRPGFSGVCISLLCIFPLMDYRNLFLPRETFDHVKDSFSKGKQRLREEFVFKNRHSHCI